MTLRGWYDFESGIACASVGTLGFVGTHEQFIERCREMNEPKHYWADLSQPGWDANGAPTEEL